eukprot:scaffold26.g3343.t1
MGEQVTMLAARLSEAMVLIKGLSTAPPAAAAPAGPLLTPVSTSLPPAGPAAPVLQPRPQPQPAPAAPLGAGQEGAGAGLAGLQALLGAAGAKPFVPQPGLFNSSTAGGVVGLDATTAQLCALLGSCATMDSTVPLSITAGRSGRRVCRGWGPGGCTCRRSRCCPSTWRSRGGLGPRASGLGPRASGLGPRASGLGPRASGLLEEGCVLIAPDPLTGGLVWLASPKARASAAQLAKALPGLTSYLAADERVLAQLTAHGLEVAGYSTFQSRMLNFAGDVEPHMGDPTLWGAFLELGQTLRLAQHRMRVKWDVLLSLRQADIVKHIAVVAARTAVPAAGQAPTTRGLTRAPAPGASLCSEPPSDACRQFWNADEVDGAYGNYSSTGTLETVVMQECVVTSGSYYISFNNSVKEMKTPQDNLQPSSCHCCQSCLAMESCNAWQWCSNAQGCPKPSDDPEVGFFPYQGCQLLDMTAYLTTNAFSSAIRATGQGAAAFVAGAPIRLSVPKLVGYETDAGVDLGAGFNYACPGSVYNVSCAFHANATDIAVRCSAEQRWSGFVFYPRGRDGVSEPLGTLKTGAISSANLSLTPFCATYSKIKARKEVATDRTQQTKVIVIATVVPAAVLLGGGLALAVTLAYRHRKQRVHGAAHKAAASGEGRKEGATRGPGSASPGTSDWPSGGADLEPPSSRSSVQPSLPGATRKEQRSGSPPLVVVEACGSGGAASRAAALEAALVAAAAAASSRGGSGGAPSSGGGFSPFMAVGPQEPAAAMAAASGEGPAAAQAAPPPAPVAEVVSALARNASSVLRSLAQGGGGGAGAEPPSTARDLLATFARMYSQRPAVDCEQAAQLLDEDLSAAGEAAADAAEACDLERPRAVAGLSGGFSGGAGGGAGGGGLRGGPGSRGAPACHRPPT